MKFWGVFRFEFGYQVRRPWPWVFFAVVLVLSLLMSRDTSLSDAMYEDFFANSPFAIAKTTVIGGLVWLLLAPVIAGEAAARDMATRMYPLIYTAPLNRNEYLGGRFLAALLLNALILLAVQAGIALGVYSSGISAAVVGPFRPIAFLTAYAYISLPNALVATAIQFGLALRTGRTMAGYLGSLFLVFMGFFVASIVRFAVAQRLGMLLDPVGINFVLEELSHEWTIIERNTRLLRLEGGILANRLVWVTIGLAAMTFTYLRFRFAHRAETGLFDLLSSLRSRVWPRGRRTYPTTEIQGEDATSIARPEVRGSDRTQNDGTLVFGFPMQLRQTLAITSKSFKAIATSWAGLALLVPVPMMTVLIVLDQMESLGTPLVPLTSRVVAELTAPVSAELSRWVIVPMMIVFFAGELIWREREAGVDEIVDAMPGSEWVPLLGKFLGIGIVLALFTTLLIAAGMVGQVILDYRTFEILLYLKMMFGLQLPEYLIFAALALVIHVLVNNKYAGHLVAIMAYVFIAVLATVVGIEHNLLVFGAGPAWSYTEMRGFSASLAPWVWFKLYWASWSLMLAVVARLLWVRGREGGLSTRMRWSRRRLAGATAWTAALAAALIMTIGGFIFYNTNVLNRYLSSFAIAERSAEYERRYRKFEVTPQPELAGTKLLIEIYPKRRAVDIGGSYQLVNRTAGAISSIHIATPRGNVDTRLIRFDRASTLAVDDKEHRFRIYTLAQPLASNDTLQMSFEVHVERRGFSSRGIDPSIAPKGSYFGSQAWFPQVGYQRQRELVGPSDRRDHRLPPRAIVAALSSGDGTEPASRGGGIAFEVVLGTDGDQVAVAPGALRQTWTNGGRRYFRYAADAPIGGEWAFFSGNYAIRQEQWNSSSPGSNRPVTIRIFHDPRHTGHVDRMMRSVRASMDYNSAQFGPYPYGHMTLVENPAGPGTGAHAEASMISHGQGFAFWAPQDDQESFDMPFAVLAHEMGHEWGLPYAIVEGAPFLSEGLAWYSAMQVVKSSRGSQQFQRLLSFMRQPYPFRPIRRGEPLLRALDPYLSYRKGPFAMYTLSEYIGSARVNGAIRRLIEQHELPGTPLVTTLDLYRELQVVTPDSLKYLLHDLFEVNTYWELAIDKASAIQTAGGMWQVTLSLKARKTVVDSAGTEADVPMDDLVQIGVDAPLPKAERSDKPLYLQLHRIRSGAQIVTVTVPRKPISVGIDPGQLLIELKREDNAKAVTTR